MKKLSVLFILSLLLVTAMSSCRKVSGTGPVVSETRSVSGFSEIKSAFSGDIIITPSSSYSVRIEAQQNIIDVIETVLNDGILTLRVKSNTVIKPDSRVKVYISSPDIRGVIVSGSGNVQFTDALTTTDLYLKVSGSGNINIFKLTANSVDANISGSGEININNGSVADEMVDISGSGSMELSNLVATNSDIKIAGSGDARVYVTGHLKVRISGSGSVYYRGTPSIDVSISGSGKLKSI
jgi:hypothetical protein